MRVIDDDERRARLGVRHALAGSATTVADAAASVVVLHATDPATVYLSAAARVSGASVASIEDALYVERSVVRMLGMRRTVFVVPAPLVPVVQSAASAAVAAKERAKLLTFIANTGFTRSPERWLRDVSRDTLAALVERGEASASELVADVPELARKILAGQGKWAGEQGASTRVLFLLAAEGHLVRGRPRGSWTSTQYRWAPTSAWLGDDPPELPVDEARTALARAWLYAFGPGTVADLKWWTGWTLTETRRTLATVPTAEVTLSDGTPAYVLADDEAPVATPDPWIALLPALDPTPMGWTSRDWYLGPHKEPLFDRNGNIGPTIWSNGHIIGGWTHHPSGEVVTHLLEDPGTETAEAVAKAAATLTTWLDPTRVIPRFRTPLERTLTETP